MCKNTSPVSIIKSYNPKNQERKTEPNQYQEFLEKYAKYCNLRAPVRYSDTRRSLSLQQQWLCSRRTRALVTAVKLLQYCCTTGHTPAPQMSSWVIPRQLWYPRRFYWEFHSIERETLQALSFLWLCGLIKASATWFFPNQFCMLAWGLLAILYLQLQNCFRGWYFKGGISRGSPRSHYGHTRGPTERLSRQEPLRCQVAPIEPSEEAKPAGVTILWSSVMCRSTPQLCMYLL